MYGLDNMTQSPSVARICSPPSFQIYEYGDSFCAHCPPGHPYRGSRPHSRHSAPLRVCNYLQIPIGAGENQTYDFDINAFAQYYNFSLLEVFNAIKLIEREGLFMTSEAMNTPSKIHVKAGREDLYRFQIEYKEYDTLIKFLLRNYPGILSDFVNIREEQISQKTNISIDKVERQLKNLDSMNFLTYIPRNDKPQIQFLTERIDVRYFTLSDEIYRNRKEDAARRIDAVIDFVNNNEDCRSVQLLRYFGENIRKTCGRCDVCSSKNKMNVTDNEYRDISETIVCELRESDNNVYEILKKVNNHHEEKVLDTIKWMIDNDIIEREGERIKLRHN